jgi:hypothetical protein
MSVELWGPVDVREWRKVPHVAGRLATESDVKIGRAVFYSPVGPQYAANRPHVMPLPLPAILRTPEDPIPVPVIVIQAEQGPQAVLAGYRPITGGNGVCTLEELELLDEPDSRFSASH